MSEKLPNQENMSVREVADSMIAAYEIKSAEDVVSLLETFVEKKIIGKTIKAGEVEVPAREVVDAIARRIKAEELFEENE